MQKHQPSAAAALRVHEPAEKVRAAQAEHDKLLGLVGKRQKELERAEQRLHDTMTRVASRIEPIREQLAALDEKVHELFAALLAEKRPARTRKKLERLHQELQTLGVISPRFRGGPVEDQDEAGDGSDVHAHAYEPPRRPIESAARPKDTGALRDLFRRLVDALHPDRVQDQAEQAHRTEVMKEVTVAYREGDFARLVEIERRWASGAPAGAAADEDQVERRLSALAEACVSLKKQQRALEKELRQLRNTHEWRMVGELERAGEEGLEELVEEGEAELANLQVVHDHVQAFREGKISLEALLAGPALDDDDDDQDGFSEEETMRYLADLVGKMMGGTAERAAPRGPGRKGRRQAPNKKRKQTRRQ